MHGVRPMMTLEYVMADLDGRLQVGPIGAKCSCVSHPFSMRNPSCISHQMAQPAPNQQLCGAKRRPITHSISMRNPPWISHQILCLPCTPRPEHEMAWCEMQTAFRIPNGSEMHLRFAPNDTICPAPSYQFYPALCYWCILNPAIRTKFVCILPMPIRTKPLFSPALCLWCVLNLAICTKFVCILHTPIRTKPSMHSVNLPNALMSPSEPSIDPHPTSL